MKRLNGTKMILVGFVAVVVLGGGNAKADFTFGEPVNLGSTVNTSFGWQGEPAISADGLELYFVSERAVGQGGSDIWVTKRMTKDDPWGQPANLGPIVNSSVDERGPCITANGLELYFVSKRAGEWHIHVSRRLTKDSEWGTPVVLANTPKWGTDSASVSGDGLELYYSFYYNSGWYEIHVMKRTTTNVTWPRGERLGSSVNAWNNDLAPCISYDGSALFYARGGGNSITYELWMSTRTSTEDPWSPCIILDAINSSGWDYAPCVSADGSMLYFESDRPGSFGLADIWQAPIIPIVDLNGDGMVDVKDVATLTDHWGENNSLCDIGPMPWGDGIVDVQDLLVLLGAPEPGLIAHWKLDETQGITARDGISGEDAFVIGDPTWQPAGGQVDGALQLDGIDDCIVTDSVLNPADGTFSVFAWIKGGAPGQVVLSQMSGANWLCLDPSDGYVMTELAGDAHDSGPLESQTVIIDEAWHQIGLVWDGSQRTLYVDDARVAQDTQDNLEGSSNGLYIGTGKNMQPGTFFSGLIDDVRIYNRAVSP